MSEDPNVFYGEVVAVSGKLARVRSGHLWLNVWAAQDLDAALQGQAVKATGWLRTKAGDKEGVIFLNLGGAFRGASATITPV